MSGQYVCKRYIKANNERTWEREHSGQKVPKQYWQSKTDQTDINLSLESHDDLGGLDRLEPWWIYKNETRNAEVMIF